MAGLTPQLLLGAYASGIFPMAESRNDPDLYWIDPDKRGIIPLGEFHIPRRLRKTLRSAPYEIRCDADFIGTIRGCAEPQGQRPETWINDEIERLYEALFDMGFAHSVECWLDDALVGGLYGVSSAVPSLAKACSPVNGMPARSRSVILPHACTRADSSCSTASLSPTTCVSSERSKSTGQTTRNAWPELSR